LKKCMPANRSGESKAEASLPTVNDDVFVATIVSGGKITFRARYTSSFELSDSVTASTTSSHDLTDSSWTDPSTAPLVLSAVVDRTREAFTLRRAAASRFGSTSTRLT